MVEINGHQNIFEAGQHSSFANRIFTEIAQRYVSYIKDLGKLAYRISSIIPQVCIWMGTSLGACGLIRYIHQSQIQGFFYNVFQFLFFIYIIRNILVTISNGAFIPFSNSSIVGIFEAQSSIILNSSYGMWIIHYGCKFIVACCKIMGNSQGVANFMSGKLANSIQSHFEHLRIWIHTCFIRRKQTFCNHIILPNTERAKEHISFDDFTGAWIDYGGTVRPATCGAVNPVDNIVTNIKRMSIIRQHLNPVGIFVSDRLKSFCPPSGAIQQGCANGFRRTIVQVVNDWLHRFTQFRGWIFLFKTMPRYIALGDIRSNRSAVVLVRNTKKTGTRIKFSRFIIIVG